MRYYEPNFVSRGIDNFMVFIKLKRTCFGVTYYIQIYRDLQLELSFHIKSNEYQKYGW